MKANNEVIDVVFFDSVNDLLSLELLTEIQEKSQSGVCCAFVTEEEVL